MPAWTGSDAWLLASLALAGDGARLGALVAAADHLDHAVPTAGEVRTALARLAGSGLVTVADGPVLALTPRGRETAAGRGVPAVLAALAAVPLREEATAWDDAAFRAAVEAYVGGRIT
ncbi:MAG TPA: hypothetical protein VFQ85_11410 [Mycobacteriales bacterium]|nr:hypothetical protein [Mycobacteriales bacterium]